MKRMSMDDLKQMLTTNADIAIVDVRDASAHEDWHIPGSISVPVMQSLRVDDPAPLQAAAKTLPHNKPLVIVCNRGNASQKATRILDEMGFDATSLDGGMLGYSLAASDVVLPLKSAHSATCIQIRRNGKGCLSYFIVSNGEAAVIDPSVDAGHYLDIARNYRAKITRVIETHVHADHVSRARELCELTSAELCIPRNKRVSFAYHEIDDGDVLRVGELKLHAIATPGHTGESMCYLLNNELLFTGDTIFVDSIGRPDLERGDEGAESSAHTLYQSLHRILELPDNLFICPAHTDAGIPFDKSPIVASLCDIKKRVAILRDDEATFVRNTLAGIGPKPPSFTTIIQINEGKQSLGSEDPASIEAGPNRCAVAATR